VNISIAHPSIDISKFSVCIMHIKKILNKNKFGFEPASPVLNS